MDGAAGRDSQIFCARFSKECAIRSQEAMHRDFAIQRVNSQGGIAAGVCNAGDANMWLVWWIRWHGLRLIFGNTVPNGKGWGQPARVRVNRTGAEFRLEKREDRR
jgi:hypothetical protein